MERRPEAKGNPDETTAEGTQRPTTASSDLVRVREAAQRDATQRPIGITALEDKIVQKALVSVLEQIHEADFLGFSYGYRPQRGSHDALDAIYVAITQGKVNWVLDADLRRFFDTLNHTWLLKFVEHRIADPRILRLLRKILRAGKPETFDFLGFTHYCTRTRKTGAFALGRKTIAKRMRGKLKDVRRTLHVRICAGGARQPASLPR